MSARHVFVPGRPAPQGSKSYKGHRGGKPILIESSKAVGPWREQIAWMARSRGGMLPPGPVRAELVFVMPRPKQTPKRTPPAIKRNGDLDKLVRAVFDAITDVWIHDDAHITHLGAHKRIAELGEQSGVNITINLIGDTE